ncbi:MAG: alpha/beta fold hydrolase [Alphaproteobacteria bacterium]|nr:alpha/beta fold hydrolase [Alphaproteobacteria bacterium SS10]
MTDVKPIDLNAVVTGDGPPLVILHGLFGQAKNWGGLTKRLGQQFTVHALDLRSHGASEAASPMTYPAMAVDLLAYIDGNDLDQPAVIGHSMGGKVSMCAALTQPSKIGKLLVADIAPVSYDHRFDVFFEALRAIDLENLKGRQAADQVLTDYIAEKPVRDFLLSNLSRNTDGGWFWDIDLPSIEADIDAITGWPEGVTGPFEGQTLFLNGGASDYVTDDMHPAISALFPKASFATMDGVGHWVHAEAPAVFLEHVTGFLG